MRGGRTAVGGSRRHSAGRGGSAHHAAGRSSSRVGGGSNSHSVCEHTTDGDASGTDDDRTDDDTADDVMHDGHDDVIGDDVMHDDHVDGFASDDEDGLQGLLALARAPADALLQGKAAEGVRFNTCVCGIDGSVLIFLRTLLTHCWSTFGLPTCLCE